MKKIITLIVLSMLLACMTACSGSDKTDPPPTPDHTISVYELLNSLVEKDYSAVKVDIVTTTGFASLNSNYVLAQSVVTYSIERLNLLPSDGNLTDLSPDFKKVTSGYAQINNGQIVEVDGNKDVTLPSYNELKGNFNFDESNFANVVLADGSFEADVVSPSQFYGADVDISNVKVKVEYTNTSLVKIVTRCISAIIGRNNNSTK